MKKNDCPHKSCMENKKGSCEARNIAAMHIANCPYMEQ
jgi:hypothetical protein